MNRLSFVFDLIDRMSGPVGGIVSTLDRLLGVTDRLGAATDRSSTRMGAAFTRLQSGMDTIKTRAESFKRTMEGIHGGIERVFSLPNIIGATVIGEVAKTVIEAGIQKERTMANFSLMLGSDTKAKQVYGDMINFAGQTPFKTDVLQRAWSKLLTDGFKEKAVPKLLSGIGDLAMASDNPDDALMNIIRIVAHTKNLGHLNGVLVRELGQSWNLSIGKLDDAIAARMHVKPSQVQKMIGSGRVDSTTGIMAMLDAIQAQYDRGQVLGTHMFLQSQTLGGLFSTLASRPMEFLGGISDTQGFDSLKQLTKNLADAFNPGNPRGEKLQGVLLSVLGKITDLIAGPLVRMTSGDGLANAAQKFADYVQLALSWWQKNGPAVVQGIKDFGSGFLDAARDAQKFYTFIKPALTWVGDQIDRLTGQKGSLGTVAHLLGVLAFGGLVLKGGGLFLDGGAAFLGFLNTITFGAIPKLITAVARLSGSVLLFGRSSFFLEMMTNPGGMLTGFRVAMAGVGASIAGMGASLAALALPLAFMADIALIVTDIKLFQGLKAQEASNANSAAQEKVQLANLAKKSPMGELVASRLQILWSDGSSGAIDQARMGVLLAQERAVKAGKMTALQALAIDKAPGGALTDNFNMQQAGSTFALGFNNGTDAKKLGTDLATAFQDKLTAPGSIAALFGAPSGGAGSVFGIGSLPSSSGVSAGPNGSWAGYGASVYSQQIGMAADVLGSKLKAAGGDYWGTNGGVRRYNGLGKNGDGSWMNPNYVSDVAAAVRDQPWLAAIKKATGPRLDELNYINRQTDQIAKTKGIDARTLKGMMWWESEGWHADLPGDQGRGGGLGQVLGYHVPARGAGMGTIGSSKPAAAGHTVSISQSFMVPAGASQQDANAMAKAARQGTHSALEHLSMHAGAS
jgi:hypothetical protein